MGRKRKYTSEEEKKEAQRKWSMNYYYKNRAVLQAKRVVICAGSWSPILLKELGIKIPVKPVKGYSLTSFFN